MLKKIGVLIVAFIFSLPLCIAHAYSIMDNQNEESIQQTVNAEAGLTPTGLLEVQVDEATAFPIPETSTILTEQASQSRAEFEQNMQEIQAIKQQEKLAAERAAKQQAIIAYADSLVGNPYVWGGASLTKGCDCSHFVWLVLRDTIGYSEGWTKSTLWLNRGTVVDSLANAEPGDVIVYQGHVALYDGNGLIVEALNKHKGIVHNRKADSTHFLGIRRFV